ncbi:MAG: sigma-54-dependent Fis family transcriptional regulator [Planctomycetota bacterium]|nr:MAG: sigma-54-dependent Fis family transcriptional regulator [Planctomycetota bacterium]
MRILVVDDEKIKRITLADDLQSQGYDVVTAEDGEQAMEKLRAERFDVVITDVKMPKVDGMELLKFIKQGDAADTAVVMMTAYGSIQLAVESMKLGAFDFVTKPFRNDEIFPLLARIERERGKPAEQAAPAEHGEVQSIDDAVIGTSRAMMRVKRMIEICTRTDANVLLWGETGVGKDLIASVIHKHSHRKEFPFVKVGCTLFPSHLIESELYGHEKGSFTGADQQRPGRFELAEGGSLYLDDVDDIPLEHQAKLLRAIEEKVFERVGGTTPIKADVRIITSTKCNLLDKVSEGTFRQDLYYRLDVLRVTIPPLRERKEDIPLLVEHLMKRIAGPREYAVEPKAIEVLQRHNWPGNVRELYHTLERAYLVGGGEITAALLSSEIIRDAAAETEETIEGDYQAVMEKTERRLLERALREAGGNKTAAAQALGMKPSTFRDKLAKHGLG